MARPTSLLCKMGKTKERPGNDLPKPQKSLGQSRARSRVSTSVRAPVPGQSSLCPPVEPARRSALTRTQRTARELRAWAGQGKAGRAGWEPDFPWERRTASPTRLAAAAAAGACVAIQLGARAGAERPPLPHASRTNKTLRSGLCEGLVAGRERRARGLAVALDLVPVFRERNAG